MSVFMIMLVTLNGQFMLGKIKVSSIGPNAKLSFHWYFLKNLLYGINCACFFTNILIPNYFDAHVFCKLFCQWLLTFNSQLNHPFLIDVIVIHSRVLRPIDWCTCSMYTAQRTLLSVIFSTTKVLYNISNLGSPTIFKCPEHFPGMCTRLFINGHNA